MFVTDRKDEHSDALPTRFGMGREVLPTCGKVSYLQEVSREIGGDFTKSISLTSGSFHSGYEECIAYVNSLLPRAGKILIYIHGYKTKFDSSIRRAIGMAHDLGFPGLILVWSWPSDGISKAPYGHDLDSIRWTTPHAIQFIDLLAKLPNVTTIDLVAHSLGNNILLSILNRMAETGTSIKMNTVVFAAPDVAQDNFREDIRRAWRDARRPNGPFNFGTLYASSRDQALEVSEIVHYSSDPGGGVRAGYGGPDSIMVDVPGVEAVDTSELPVLIQDPRGHSYVFGHPSAVDDLTKVIVQNLHATQRRLEERVKGNGRYWLLRE